MYTLPEGYDLWPQDIDPYGYETDYANHRGCKKRKEEQGEDKYQVTRARMQGIYSTVYMHTQVSLHISMQA